MYPFFGLTDEYKGKLHEVLFDLTHFGNFEYESVYGMPVQYRQFYIRKLINIKEKEKEQMDKDTKTPSQSKSIARGPQIQRK